MASPPTMPAHPPFQGQLLVRPLDLRRVICLLQSQEGLQGEAGSRQAETGTGVITSISRYSNACSRVSFIL